MNLIDSLFFGLRNTDSGLLLVEQNGWEKNLLRVRTADTMARRVCG